MGVAVLTLFKLLITIQTTIYLEHSLVVLKN